MGNKEENVQGRPGQEAHLTSASKRQAKKLIFGATTKAANATPSLLLDELEGCDTEGMLVSLSDLEACFNNLTNVVKVKRTTLKETMKNVFVLTATTTNSKLVGTNKKLRAQIDALKENACDNGGRDSSTHRRYKQSVLRTG